MEREGVEHAVDNEGGEGEEGGEVGVEVGGGGVRVQVVQPGRGVYERRLLIYHANIMKLIWLIRWAAESGAASKHHRPSIKAQPH